MTPRKPHPMTDEEFDALRERVKGHTPGPWQQPDGHEGGVTGTVVVTGLPGRTVHEFPGQPYYDRRPHEEWFEESVRNAALIASAPDLLAYAEQLRDENEKLRRLLACEVVHFGPDAEGRVVRGIFVPGPAAKETDHG